MSEKRSIQNVLKEIDNELFNGSGAISKAHT